MIKLKQTFSVTIDEYNGISDKDYYVEEVKHELKKALGEKVLEKVTESNGWPCAMISDYQFTMERRSPRIFFTASISIDSFAPALTLGPIMEDY